MLRLNELKNKKWYYIYFVEGHKKELLVKVQSKGLLWEIYQVLKTTYDKLEVV